jgi:hypothetical protein
VAVTDQQILRGAAAATLSVVVRDSDGEPVAPTGAVTVGVTRSDGSTVVAAGTATGPGGTAAERTVTLNAAAVADLDVLTATWTNGDATWTTTAEVVGGFYAALADIRSADPALADTERNPARLLVAARRIVETEFEDICGRAFVPRFTVELLDGTGTDTLNLSAPLLRRVRWARHSDGTPVGVNVASIPADPAGIAVRDDGGVWPAGTRNIEVGFEHGYDRPPPDVRDAFIARLRDVVNRSRRGISERATTFTATEGGTYGLAVAGRGGSITGLPDVDVVLRRYTSRVAGFA